METIVANVVRRFVHAGRTDPPRWMLRAVDEGAIDPESVDIWDYIVESLGEHYDEAAAAAYWQNKASKVGFEVPGGLGPRASGRWTVEVGDSIEEWRKANAKSKDLIEEQSNLIDRWLRERPESDVTRDLKDLRKVTESYDGHTTPTIDFERNFQFALLLVDKKLDKRQAADLPIAISQLRHALRG